MSYYVYILLCEDGIYSTGIARDVESRFEEHRRGLGARYTRMRRPLRIVYVEEVNSLSEAVKRELQIKSLSHDEKSQLIPSHGKNDKVAPIFYVSSARPSAPIKRVDTR